MIKKRNIFKNLMIKPLLTMSIVSIFSYGICPIPPISPICPCIPLIPCTGVLNCVMEKQKNTLEARLDDLKHTIEANTKQTIHQTKIIEQEVLAYKRLLERVKIENISLKKASYLSKKIKDSKSLDMAVDTIKKGKQ